MTTCDEGEPLTEDHPRDKDAKSEEESFGKLQTPFRGVGTVAVIQAFLLVEVVIESESDEVCRWTMTSLFVSIVS